MNKMLLTTAVLGACLTASLFASAEEAARPATTQLVRKSTTRGQVLILDGTVASVGEKSLVVRHPHGFDKTKTTETTVEVDAKTMIYFAVEQPGKDARTRTFNGVGPAKWEDIKEGIHVMVPLPEWAYPVTDAELQAPAPAYALNGKPFIATRISIMTTAPATQPTASPN